MAEEPNEFERIRAGLTSDGAKACVDLAEQQLTAGEKGVRRIGECRQFLKLALTYESATLPAAMAEMKERLDQLEKRQAAKTGLRAVQSAPA